MVLKAVLFDLDGTLADTAPSLGKALNALLREEGREELPLAAIRPMAGAGAAELLKLGFKVSAEDPEFARLNASFLHYYARFVGTRTALFPGITKVIASLGSMDLKWGIVTNKREVFTERLLPHLALPTPPGVVVCGDTTAAAKPSPIPLLFACEKLTIKGQEALYVGDGERDIRAGEKAGMKTAAALWGYLNEDAKDWGADYNLAAPTELMPLIRSLI